MYSITISYKCKVLVLSIRFVTLDTVRVWFGAVLPPPSLPGGALRSLLGAGCILEFIEFGTRNGS